MSGDCPGTVSRDCQDTVRAELLEDYVRGLCQVAMSGDYARWLCQGTVRGLLGEYVRVL